MYVKNWRKWTAFKKKLVGLFMTIGVLCVFSMEQTSITVGCVGVAFALLSTLILFTIRPYEW